MTGSATALLFVQADVEAGHEAEWNRWYNEKHVPDLLSRPGFLGGRRFERVAEGVGVAGPLPRYLAAYDLADAAALNTDEYRAIRQPPIYTEQDRSMLRLFRNANRAVFAQIGEWPAGGADVAAAGGLIAAGLVPTTEGEEEYNAWYEQEHIPYILAVPGVLRVRRFRALEGEPAYLALWDLTAPEVRGSEAFARAADTPWSARIRQRCERKVTGLYRPVTEA